MAQEVAQMALQTVGDPAMAIELLSMAIQVIEQAAQAPQPVYARQGTKMIRIR
jgi:hypothetical protein